MTVGETSALTQGFVLTRQARDRGDEIEITLWVKTAENVQKLVIYNEQALFFVASDHADYARQLLAKEGAPPKSVRALPLKSFQQVPVSAFYFSTLKSFYRARALLKDNQIKCFEGDFRPDERYLTERFITANIEFTGERTQEKHQPNNYLQVSGAKCRALEHKTQRFNLSMLSVDIECSMQGELYSIAAYAPDVSLVFMIGKEETNKSQNEDPEQALLIEWLADESQLLTRFIEWLCLYDPDIVIGWNVVNFDMVLLQKRCDLHDINFAIGRDGQTPYWRDNRNSGQKYIEIAGRVVLDGIDLLKTATYSFASFSLNNVATQLLGMQKQVDDVDNRVAEITHNFHHNKYALAQYNLQDCRLVWLIFEKTQLLDFAQLRAQLTGLEIDRFGGSVAAFTNLYLPKLHRSGYVAPSLGDSESDLVSPGGYVMDSIPGLYDNILVLDFKSLYPSIIRTFNIDPMGMVEGLLAPENAIEGFDGALFSRDKHFLPDIIKDLWAQRDIAKKEQNAALSQAIKIIMNSFYGVLGSSGCRFFDPRLSGSITKRGHQLLKQTKDWIEEKGYQVIYGDTDSIFVHIKGEHDANECRAIGKSLEQFINQTLTLSLKKDYGVESELELEFETHFSKFLMPTIRGLEVGTKKRYAGLVIENGEQHIVFKGLESVRTDWTELAKQFQQSLYHRVFNNLPVKDYVLEMVHKTYAGEHDELLVYRKRIRRKLDEYVKNVPPHIKAARNADEQNKALGKPLRYQKKGHIEYLMTINGPQATEYINSPLDYQLYIDRQLAPIADAILPFIGTSFTEIVDQQLSLFS